MNALQQSLLLILENIDLQKLKRSSSSLTQRYHEGGSLKSEEELLAYLIVRLPATYAVLRHIFSRMPPGSLLDLGAGPGTAWWAAKEAWNLIPSVTAIEREQKFIDLGKKLGTQASWIHGNFLSFDGFDAHDWVIFSYSLGEIAENERASLLAKSWHAAKKGIVVVEPGTPSGYRRTLSARNLILELGGSILAPCPHADTCPLKGSVWCHFSVRLERSFLHRYAKEATLPFEDEKFAYCILTKDTVPPQKEGRLLRPPARHGGHVTLSLCTPSGLQNLTISRSQKIAYKKARKSAWGDSWKL